MIVIFTFLCVMVVTAVLFGGWVIMSIIRLIGRAFTGPPEDDATGSSARICANPGCRTINPLHASYCRRCGTNLSNPMTNARPTAQRRPQYDPANGNGRQVASV